MKSETLEEAAEKYPYGGREGSQRKAFIEGAKWQIKQLEVNNKSFICDGCDEEIFLDTKFPMVDENYKIQYGLFECSKCRGL